YNNTYTPDNGSEMTAEETLTATSSSEFENEVTSGDIEGIITGALGSGQITKSGDKLLYSGDISYVTNLVSYINFVKPGHENLLEDVSATAPLADGDDVVIYDKNASDADILYTDSFNQKLVVPIDEFPFDKIDVIPDNINNPKDKL